MSDKCKHDWFVIRTWSHWAANEEARKRMPHYDRPEQMFPSFDNSVVATDKVCLKCEEVVDESTKVIEEFHAKLSEEHRKSKDRIDQASRIWENRKKA